MKTLIIDTLAFFNLLQFLDCSIFTAQKSKLVSLRTYGKIPFLNIISQSLYLSISILHNKE